MFYITFLSCVMSSSEVNWTPNSYCHHLACPAVDVFSLLSCTEKLLCSWSPGSSKYFSLSEGTSGVPSVQRHLFEHHKKYPKSSYLLALLLQPYSRFGNSRTLHIIRNGKVYVLFPKAVTKFNETYRIKSQLGFWVYEGIWHWKALCLHFSIWYIIKPVLLV